MVVEHLRPLLDNPRDVTCSSSWKSSWFRAGRQKLQCHPFVEIDGAPKLMEVLGAMWLEM